MNRKTYRPTRGKRSALAMCSLLLNLSACGCSGIHESHAFYVDSTKSVCTAEAYRDSVGSATAGEHVRTLVVVRTR